ncbi:MAG: hypothetical protein AAF390_00550 [Pseudomonadota bacterium]
MFSNSFSTAWRSVLPTLSAVVLAWGAAPARSQEVGPPIPCGEPYTVVRGDTLGDISVRAYGRGAYRLFYETNVARVGQNPDLIEVGLVLRVPCLLGQIDVTPPQEADFSAPPEETPGATPETQPDGTEVTIVFNRAAAPNFIMNVGIIDEYMAEVAEVTEGRVRFVDPPVTDRDPRAQYDIVRRGEVDGAYIFNGYLAESHPLLQLPMQPLMGGTAEQTAVALWRLHADYLSRTDYMDEVHLLGFVGFPAAHIWRLREAPVAPGEDLVEQNEYTIPYFDGLDTRGAESVREENAEWLATFDESQGRSLTFALAHGAALAGGIWNENRTVTEIDGGVYTPTFSVFLSREAWCRISEADRARIDAISGEALSARSAAWDAFDNRLRARMLEEGLSPVTADLDLLAELQDQSRIGVEAWIAAADAAGIPGFQAVQDYSADLDALAPEETARP